MGAAKRGKRPSARAATGRLILVLGGASSGKSEVALRLAGHRGPRAFLATGQALDEEMAERIARHRASRSADWHTVEIPRDIEVWLATEGPHYHTILIDCLTLWLNNLMMVSEKESAIRERTSTLLRAARRTNARVVMVSNELGLGLVPADRSSRAFRDLAGRVNQQIAAEVDEVHLVLSGLPFKLK
ncbi:MAG: bifunctional adenosylcobinamide kinase/adenosylcobinamide-phosphate guanylyltransferase [Nitrospira sp.]|nr:bifunctional adenosylcobinamide kinase/adenosylcobinamide-phosphate guanylyltransferase [Nitrospira sp.]